MPGEGDRGERRSRRGADGEVAEQEGGGDKRKRIHDEPGYVPDPEALARISRAKRAKEEAAKKEAAEKAAAEQEAAAAAAAAVAEAAEAAAKAAVGANQSNPRERAMSADGRAHAVPRRDGPGDGRRGGVGVGFVCRVSRVAVFGYAGGGCGGAGDGPGARGEDGAVEGRGQDHGLDPTPAGRAAVVHVREDRVTDGRAEVGRRVVEQFDERVKRV